MRTAAAAVALIFVATAAHAQYTGDVDCAHAMTQRDMNVCADRDYRTADARLNDAYRAAMARLGPADRDRLKTEERDWIARRDSQCKAEAAESEGGSMHPMELAGCMTEKTKARTRELEGR